MAELENFIQSWEQNKDISRGACSNQLLKKLDDLINERQLDTAKGICLKAIYDFPLEPNFLMRIANISFLQRDYRDAIKYTIRAMRMTPDPTLLYNNFALMLMKAGKYRIAARYFSYVVENYVKNSYLGELNIPFWYGESLENKIITIIADRGIGDHINFFPIIEKLVNKYNCLIFYQAKPPYDDLVKNSFKHERVFYFRSFEDIHKTDYVTTNIAAYLTYLINQNVHFHETKWPVTPYLIPLKAHQEKWQQLVTTASVKKKRIGICWTGHVESDNNLSRSIPLTLILEKMTDLQDQADFYLLGTRKDHSPYEEDIKHSNVIDLRDHIKTVSDSAALIDQMDVVISVCTAEGHIAGALQKRTFLFLSLDHCWRWQMTGKETGFYPTMTLLRQNQENDWKSPLEVLSVELRKTIRINDVNK